jgi:uncharacterized protein YwgA
MIDYSFKQDYSTKKYGYFSPKVTKKIEPLRNFMVDQTRKDIISGKMDNEHIPKLKWLINQTGRSKSVM